MSGGQTFQWANHFPGFMDIAIAFCGCERTSLHNQVFLEGIKRVLPAANEISCAASKNGRLETVGKEVRSWSDDERAVGLKASARVYAGCGFSQTLDRHRIQQNDYAAKDLEDFLIILWESWELDNDPENLLVILPTWQDGDHSQQVPYGGKFEEAMRAIKAS